MSSYRDKLAQLENTGRLRYLKPLSGREGCHIKYGRHRMLNMTSNDYLGFGGTGSCMRGFSWNPEIGIPWIISRLDLPHRAF
ncbi:hypothetical protein DGMP_16430 [Desulfomarina profundi]|uniref:8-amino-7-oxononanoate synthase n=1 Tax=Desulfomarina profundi TaxID=2772557 RepID=A0A8D5JP68_9BACT|nr:hypothetical protein [Desulfomarina profundi]BCL60950.1 hypothetical protein DGMP_16430 [Desulfomarina profundi]